MTPEERRAARDARRRESLIRQGRPVPPRLQPPKPVKTTTKKATK